MSDWNPNLYLKFERDRNKPAFDLLCRIKNRNPKRILDIGCGPGNSTRLIREFFPNADITGLDNSPNMIASAKEANPGINWILEDAGKELSHLGTYDIVFSNAALQWLPEHERLLPGLFKLVADGGVFAVQIPHNYDSPIHQKLQEMAESEKWNRYFPVERTIIYEDTGFYYDILSFMSRSFEIWTTKYIHVMDSHEDIIEWYKSTGFRPYLDRLSDKAPQEEFLADMLGAVKGSYSAQSDGKILFEFERLFLTVEKELG